jgi:phosphatidylserine/phosphatidylglycerophosphate/cardiolipin synthase-like enzyme
VTIAFFIDGRLQLNLFPGKRELWGEHLENLEPATEPMAKIFRESLRFPIYVHSKMMIVDDVYIIVGSANINQVPML